ncbi:Arabinanase/levansucrase/invertase [Exidia glandulosa HHB12029]|uniref:Arabinanase/levansucrase/invertase n=1 Tax=Exidia glandulosa HHB12029 TaxID=1314781 RepID=A0A165M7H2_EXIGL|nr:Arabinanase/levansucrase/invertase [Exidia glandulosa HHB12029]
MSDEEHDTHYNRWRPSFHVLPFRGWMNDPCGLGYDPSSRLYHLAFQWNPTSAHWGDIVWGSATSRDMVSWTVSTTACLERDAPYDCAGVFTGCLHVHVGPGPRMTYIYTAVSHLPIHYTLPYVRGCEQLALASSTDGGKTWCKSPPDPVLNGPPESLSVTGWRDPYVARWPTMSERLGLASRETLFGCISGGIRDETPTAFFYTVNEDLNEWRYIGLLMRVGLNFSTSRWSGDLGVNWEVVNFMTLSDGDGASQDFLLVGAEGCNDNKRTARASLWVACRFSSESLNPSSSSSPLLEHTYGGVFDHGLYYAANSFWDPVTERRVVFGWVTEEDLPVELQERQGWSGCLSLPRGVSLRTLRRVTCARASRIQDITSIQLKGSQSSDGKYTLRTLRIVPDDRLEQLRVSAEHTVLTGVELHQDTGTLSAYLRTSRWELSCDICVGVDCARVGVVIYHEDSCTRTSLYWLPSEEEFVVERPALATEAASLSLPAERAPHTLFTARDPLLDEENEELLKIHAFFDTSVLEIFLNERTVITTRVYTPGARCTGLAFFAEGDAFMTRCEIWDGLA